MLFAHSILLYSLPSAKALDQDQNLIGKARYWGKKFMGLANNSANYFLYHLLGSNMVDKWNQYLENINRTLE